MGGIEEEEGGEEFCDTCVLVDSVSSSSVAWGAHLCGGNGKRSIGCGPVPGGGGFFCHLHPGAYFLKTLSLGLFTWCGLILFGEGVCTWFSFLSVLAASFDFFLSRLAFVFSIAVSWVMTWGGGRKK